MIYIWFRWKDKVSVWFRQRNKIIAIVVVMYIMFFGWRCWVLYDDAEYLFLQVTMSSSVNSNAQIYYDLGQGLNEKQSQQMHMTRQEDLRPYRFGNCRIRRSIKYVSIP